MSGWMTMEVLRRRHQWMCTWTACFGHQTIVVLEIAHYDDGDKDLLDAPSSCLTTWQAVGILAMYWTSLWSSPYFFRMNTLSGIFGHSGVTYQSMILSLGRADLGSFSIEICLSFVREFAPLYDVIPGASSSCWKVLQLALTLSTRLGLIITMGLKQFSEWLRRVEQWGEPYRFFWYLGSFFGWTYFYRMWQ